MQSGGLPVVSRLRVAPLSGDIGARRIDRRKLVASDSPRQHFLFSCGGIEPPPVAVLHERHREWPVFIADDQRLAIGSGVLEMPLLRARRPRTPAGSGAPIAGSEESINSFPSGPKIASNDSRFPALTVSTSAFTASSGVGNVRWVLVCASTTPVNRHALRSAAAAMRRRR